MKNRLLEPLTAIIFYLVSQSSEMREACPSTKPKCLLGCGWGGGSEVYSICLRVVL